MAECRLEQSNDVLMIYLSGEIDHHAAACLRERIDPRILSGNFARVVLDFGGVTFMDSSGIGLILGRYRLLQNLGGTLAVQRADPQVTRLLRLSGIADMVILERGAKV